MKGADIKRFSSAVLALQDCASPGDLGPALVRAMTALFDAEMHVAGWIGAGDVMSIAASSVPYPTEAALETLRTHFHEHPLEWVVEQSRRGDHQAGRWSDTTKLRQFQKTALYRNYYRHMGTRHQLGLGLHIRNGGIVTLTFNRSRTDFRPEDARILELFARHVRDLIRRLKSRADMEDALALRDLATVQEAVLIVDDKGRLRFATDRARQLVRDYFGRGSAAKLPKPLRAWLAQLPVAGKRLTQTAAGRELTVECVAEVSALPVGLNESLPVIEKSTCGLRLLRLNEPIVASPATLIQQLGLTGRQAEVLHWMVQGKRNPEIALILGISARTVDKHRENIFATLGVETRTSAVAMAWEQLARV